MDYSSFLLACDAQRKLERKTNVSFCPCLSAFHHHLEIVLLASVTDPIKCQESWYARHAWHASSSQTHVQTVHFHLVFSPSAFQFFASNGKTTKQLNTNAYSSSSLVTCVMGTVYKYPSHPYNFQEETAATKYLLINFSSAFQELL